MRLGMVLHHRRAALGWRRQIGRRFGIENGQHVLKLLDRRDDGRPQLGRGPPTGAVLGKPFAERSVFMPPGKGHAGVPK